MHTGLEGPILVVESDRQLGNAITDQLVADGFSVELARTAEHARVLAAAHTPRLAVLGWLESPRGALALLEEIRRCEHAHEPWDRSLPAIVMGSQVRELDLLRAFEAGADDFLARPATYLELRARLRAILRRTDGGSALERVIEVGPLKIDTTARVVTLEQSIVHLRRMEFDLLAHLAREPDRVFAREELLRAVWQYRCGGSTRTVDSHASRLRRKLTAHGRTPWVTNVWGVGYRLT
jgi:DNA-binding response OmpR family regulator